jgi:hypothetical protein
MTALTFAFLTGLSGDFKELLNDLLLVAGGFLFGYLLGGFLGWAIGKWAFRQKAPEALQRIGRPCGGFVLALIVALIVFTGKGKPQGDGGDGKGVSSTEASKEKNASPKVDVHPQSDVKISVPKLDPSQAEATIRVTILAGQAVPMEGKYYLLDDESRDRARSLSEIKRTILERKEAAKGKVALAILFPSDPNSAPPRNDKKVTDVTRWAAEEAGLDVTFPASR